MDHQHAALVVHVTGELLGHVRPGQPRIGEEANPAGRGRGAGELDVGNARLLRCLDDRRRGLEREGAADDDVDVIPDQLVQLLDLRGNAVVGDPDDHLADVLVLVAELLNAADELGAERGLRVRELDPDLVRRAVLGLPVGPWARLDRPGQAVVCGADPRRQARQQPVRVGRHLSRDRPARAGARARGRCRARAGRASGTARGVAGARGRAVAATARGQQRRGEHGAHQRCQMTIGRGTHFQLSSLCDELQMEWATSATSLSFAAWVSGVILRCSAVSLADAKPHWVASARCCSG